MSLEPLFSTSELNVVVPDTTLEFPSETTTDDWLFRAKVSKIERKQAFFDEQLQSLLVLRIKPPAPTAPTDPENPPELLLEFLSHLQVSLEATYISSVPQPGPNDTPRTPASRISAPPRTSSLGPPKPSGRMNAHHPSIFPPSTPHPMPSTGEQDRKYISSEGTLLLATIWGANTAEDSPETFSLLWSEKEEVWVAVYRLSLTVSFLRLNFSDPLLCLTVSATLRDKRIINTDKHPLAKYLATLGLEPPESPTTPIGEVLPESEEKLLDGLEEVNLLAGLAAGPTFAGADPPLDLPSIRLGQVTRQKLYSLPPILVDTPVAPSPSPMTAVRKSLPTLRKSYRRTLQTVSGFRVRMRTVFVPYVLLPETEGTHAELDDAEKERERREAGSAERTVVLCVEIENSGESGIGAGFVVEKVDVKIGGEGAKATLIGWGENGFSSDAAKNTFPLRIGPLAQYNLLYAVTFLRSPEEMDAFSFARAAGVGGPSQSDLQRAVTINIFGKPYIPTRSSTKPSDMLYPTNTFSSRWNCVLDLAAHQAQALDAMDVSDPAGGYPSILPEPASPFPVYAVNSASSRTPYTGSGTPTYSAGSTPQASSRRSTLTPGGYFAGRPYKGLTPNRSAMFLHPGFASSPLNSGGRLSTSSVPISGKGHRFPTTYSAPPPPPPHTPGIPLSSPGTEEDAHPPPFDTQTPQTPAYPAFPPKSTIPPSPMSLGPIASQTQANVGPSVEIRRERGVGNEVPRTPGPFVPSAFGEQRMLSKLQGAAVSGESIVVSVGLLPLESGGEGGRRRSVVGSVLGPGKIYPLDVFTLDIFVFNQSGWPRRLEVTCPGEKRRGKGKEEERRRESLVGGGLARKMGYPGVLAMDSRVRIGPLRPSSCQSVRMDFLAVSPGVHSIDTLTLTDVETGFAMNLRAVMDIVVHDPDD